MRKPRPSSPFHRVRCLLPWLCIFPVLALAQAQWTEETEDLTPAQAKRAIIVGGDRDYAPYEWLDSKGRSRGFNIDLIRALGEVMGFATTFQLGTLSEVRKDLEAGRIDVLPMYVSSEGRRLVDFSEPHTIVYYEIYARQSADSIHSLQEIRDREVIVRRESFIHDYLRNHKPGIKLILVDSEPDALRLLASGMHDYAVVSQIGGLEAVGRYKLSNLKTTGPPLLPRGYALAVTKGNRELRQQLNRGLAILKATGRYSEIYNRWFGDLIGGRISLAMMLSYTAWALIPLTLLATGALAWSGLLKKQVGQRTRALQRELSDRRQAEQALRNSEDRLRDATEAANDWIWEMDQALRFTYLSERFYELTHISPTQVLGKTRWQVAGVSAARGKWHEHRKMLEKRLPFRDFVYKTGVADGQGQGHYFNISGKPVFDSQGEFKGYRGTGTDITAKVEAEIALQESQRTLLTLMDNLPGMAYRCRNDRNRTMEFVSSGCLELTGYQPEDFIQNTAISYATIVHPDERDRIWTEVQTALGKKTPFQLTYRIRTRTGSEKWAWEQGCGVFSDDGTLQALEGLIIDVTDRKHALEALRASEKHLRRIIDLVPHMIFAKNREGKFLLANEAVAKAYGTTVEQLVGHEHQAVHQINHEIAAMSADDLEVIDGGRSKFILEEIFTDFRGRQRIMQTIKIPFTQPGNNEPAVLGVAIDITEQKHAQEERMRMRLYLKNIIDSMPSVLIGVDTRGHLTEWNQAAEKWSDVSWQQAKGHFFGEIFPQLMGQWNQVRASIETGRPMKTQRVATKVGGHVRYDDIMVYPLIADGAIGAVIRVDNVTARVRIEEMMVQTEKMLSIGGLAAGMAHEINNPLGTILQGTQNIRRRLSPELNKNRQVAEQLGVSLESIRHYLTEREILHFLDGIHEAGTRAAKIVTDMLSFSRRSDLRFAEVDLDELLDTVVRLANSDYNLKKQYDFKRIRIIKDYDPNLTRVTCDKTEIEQVVLNLIKNAAQAISSATTPTPTITLRTRREQNYARIEVQDNGPGMEEKIRKRVFEPFFTTKEVGVGTGLGLSVSYFIITDQHRGTLSVSSKPGEQTRFVIRLPLKDQVRAAGNLRHA